MNSWLKCRSIRPCTCCKLIREHVTVLVTPVSFTASQTFLKQYKNLSEWIWSKYKHSVPCKRRHYTVSRMLQYLIKLCFSYGNAPWRVACIRGLPTPEERLKRLGFFSTLKHLDSLHRFIKVVELATMGVATIATNLDSNSRKITNTPIWEKKLKILGGWGNGGVEFDPGYFLPKSTIYKW